MERKLTAILAADVKGYSRLMGEDEVGTLRTLTTYRKLVDTLIEQHHGRIVSTAGDSVLAEFASVIDAVQCAVVVQTTLKAENTNLPLDRRMELRIGINLGDVIVEGEQIYGDGVNIAAHNKALRYMPNYLFVHTGLAAVYSEIGREEEAKAEAAEVLRLNPYLSLEGRKERLPYKDPAQTERFLAALRKAGLK
jgi:hypothetical protein